MCRRAAADAAPHALPSALWKQGAAAARRHCVLAVTKAQACSSTAAQAAAPPRAARQVGRPSDVWSLGCILYQMVTGHTPFAALAFIQKMHAITDPAHAIDIPPLRNAALADVIRRCLDRNPRTRITMPARARPRRAPAAPCRISASPCRMSASIHTSPAVCLPPSIHCERNTASEGCHLLGDGR